MFILNKIEFNSWRGCRNSAATYFQKFGGDLEPKRFDSTWTPSSRLCRLNGGDSQVYAATWGSRRTSLCLCFTPLNRARTENAFFSFWWHNWSHSNFLQHQCHCALMQTVHEQRPFGGVDIFFSFRAIAYLLLGLLHRWAVECVRYHSYQTAHLAYLDVATVFIFISPYR